MKYSHSPAIRQQIQERSEGIVPDEKLSSRDIAKEVGFKVEVDDEGEYFETRDIKILAKKLEEYNGIVLKIGNQLKELIGKENVISAIDKSQSKIIIK